MTHGFCHSIPVYTTEDDAAVGSPFVYLISWSQVCLCCSDFLKFPLVGSLPSISLYRPATRYSLLYILYALHGTQYIVQCTPHTVHLTT